MYYDCMYVGRLKALVDGLDSEDRLLEAPPRLERLLRRVADPGMACRSARVHNSHESTQQ